MKFKKLRITWSVFWGVACVLLIVLWVRSYWFYDKYRGSLSATYHLHAESVAGRFYGGLRAANYPHPFPGLRSQELTDASSTWLDDVNMQPNALGFKLRRYVGSADPRLGAGALKETGLVMPYWFAVLIAAVPSAIVWIRIKQRFTLRTLMIATTLVAVVLGLVVYAASN